MVRSGRPGAPPSWRRHRRPRYARVLGRARAESTVSPAMVVVFTLAAACLYALASVLQHRAASEVPPEHSLRLSLLRRLVARPMWLGGKAARPRRLRVQAVGP